MKSRRYFLGVIISILGIIVPAYISYDLWGRGSDPEKYLELRQEKFINPMAYLSDLNAAVLINGLTEDNGGELKEVPKDKDRRYEKAFLLMQSNRIKNIGNSPIKPSDYDEPISITVDKQWRIIGVISNSDVHFRKWTSINDSTIVAESILLNPGDVVSVDLYMINNKIKKTKLDDLPNIKWHARIINMKSFIIHKKPNAENDFSIKSYLDGDGLLFTLVGFVFVFSVYLYMINMIGYIGNINLKSTYFIIIASLLSLSASESMSTYLFPSHLYAWGEVTHTFNMPPIVINSLTLILLFIYYLKPGFVRKKLDERTQKMGNN